MDESRARDRSIDNNNDGIQEVPTVLIKNFEGFDDCKTELLTLDSDNKSALRLWNIFQTDINEQNKVSRDKLMEFFLSFDSSTNGKLKNCERCKKFLIHCHDTLFTQQREEALYKMKSRNLGCFMWLATGFKAAPKSLVDAENNFYAKSIRFKVNCGELGDNLRTYHSSIWEQLYKLFYYRQMPLHSVASGANHCPVVSEKYKFCEIIRLINESPCIKTGEEKRESCFTLQLDLSSILPIETIEELLQPINSGMKKHRFEQSTLSVIGHGLRRQFMENAGKEIAILIIKGRFIIKILDKDDIPDEYKNNTDPSSISVDEFLIKYSEIFAAAPCLSGDLIYIPANSVYLIQDFGLICSFLEFEVTIKKKD